MRVSTACFWAIENYLNFYSIDLNWEKINSIEEAIIPEYFEEFVIKILLGNANNHIIYPL